MTSGLPVAFALTLVLANCSVYEPSLLIGDGASGGSAAAARGGNPGKSGAGGTGGTAASAGTSGNSGGVGGKGAGGSGATSAGSGFGSGGDAGGFGEAGEGAGGEVGGGEGGVGGSSTSGAGGSAGGVTGTGGGSGTEGTSGSAGSSGASAGSANVGGGSGTGGSSGVETCSGCGRFVVPLAGPTDQAHFLMSLPANTDFTDAVLTFRVFRHSGTGGQVRGYVQHGGDPDFAFLELGITELADLSGWENLSYDLSLVTGYDKTVVRRVGLEITGAGSSSWTMPTVVYLDSISVENTTLDPSMFTFDAEADVTTTSSSVGPPDQSLWLNDSPDDTSVAASISWLGP